MITEKKSDFNSHQPMKIARTCLLSEPCLCPWTSSDLQVAELLLCLPSQIENYFVPYTCSYVAHYVRAYVENRYYFAQCCFRGMRHNVVCHAYARQHQEMCRGSTTELAWLANRLLSRARGFSTCHAVTAFYLLSTGSRTQYVVVEVPAALPPS